MEHATDVARYLESAVYRVRQEESQPRFGLAPFVTISRQAGADGHMVAGAVLDALGRRRGPAYEGWEVFDAPLFRIISEEPRLKVSLRYLLEEEYHSRMTDFLEQTLGEWTPQDVVQARILRSVRALCGAGKVVVVGRAGACASAGLPGGIHVRLISSPERRLRKVMRSSGLSERMAKRRLRERDEARRRLVYDHFHRDIEDPLLYDAVFNTDRLPAAEVAAWIVGEIEKKALLLEATAARLLPEGSA